MGTDGSASFAHRSSEAKGVPSNRSWKRLGRYDKVVVTWANTQEALKKAKEYHETGESARTTRSQRYHGSCIVNYLQLYLAYPR